MEAHPMKQYSFYSALLVFLVCLLGCGKATGVDKEKAAKNQLRAVTGYIELDISDRLRAGFQPSIDEIVRRIRSQKGDEVFACWIDPKQMVCINPSTEVWLNFVTNSVARDRTNSRDVLVYIPVPLQGANATSQFYLGHTVGSPEFIKLDKRPAWNPLSF